MAHFQSGQKKPQGSGRKKGTPNRRTQALQEIFEAHDFVIPEKIIEILPRLSIEKQAEILMDLMSYLYPKRKATEAMPNPTEGGKIVVEFVSPI